jgi:hypothetical protein
MLAPPPSFTETRSPYLKSQRRVDFGKYADPQTGVSTPTTKGMPVCSRTASTSRAIGLYCSFRFDDMEY